MKTVIRELKSAIAAMYAHLDTMHADVARRHVARCLFLINAQVNTGEPQLHATAQCVADARLWIENNADRHGGIDSDYYILHRLLDAVWNTYKLWLARIEYKMAYRAYRQIQTLERVFELLRVLYDNSLPETRYLRWFAICNWTDTRSQYMRFAPTLRVNVENAYHDSLGWEKYDDGTWSWEHGIPFRYPHLVDMFYNGIDTTDDIPF